MILLDGRMVRDKIKEALKKKVVSLDFVPKLLIIDVGGYKETLAYVNQKKIFGDSIGVAVDHKIFTEDAGEDAVVACVEEANTDPEVLGIIVQLPLPDGYDEQKILDTVVPQKDIDGLTTFNMTALYEGKKPYFVPATARGVMELLDFYTITTQGKAVIIGSSNLTGSPIAKLLENKGMNVVDCDSETKDIEVVARDADILVSATGVPHLVNRNFVKTGQVIIDVGYALKPARQSPDGGSLMVGGEENEVLKVYGDVDFEDVKDVISAITPVPGGVGPMTVAGLFENLLSTVK